MHSLYRVFFNLSRAFIWSQINNVISVGQMLLISLGDEETDIERDVDKHNCWIWDRVLALISQRTLILLLSKGIFNVPLEVTVQEQLVESKTYILRILILEADSWGPLLYFFLTWLCHLGWHTYVSKPQFPQF